MRPLLTLLLTALWLAADGQKFTLTVINDNYAKGRMDRPTKSLYELLGAHHYTAVFKLPKDKKYEVVLVMKSVYKDSIAAIDTLVNSMRWQKMIVGGAPFDPKEDAFAIGQHIDSVHYKVKFRLGNMNSAERTVALPWPNHGYMLDEGLRSSGKEVPLELGKPIPFMVLTQPYPDPPPPKKAVVYRYCFGSDVPPEQWPATYGVEHLFVFELTLLP